MRTSCLFGATILKGRDGNMFNGGNIGKITTSVSIVAVCLNVTDYVLHFKPLWRQEVWIINAERDKHLFGDRELIIYSVLVACMIFQDSECFFFYLFRNSYSVDHYCSWIYDISFLVVALNFYRAFSPNTFSWFNSSYVKSVFMNILCIIYDVRHQLESGPKEAVSTEPCVIQSCTEVPSIEPDICLIRQVWAGNLCWRWDVHLSLKKEMSNVHIITLTHGSDWQPKRNRREGDAKSGPACQLLFLLTTCHFQVMSSCVYCILTR